MTGGENLLRARMVSRMEQLVTGETTGQPAAVDVAWLKSVGTRPRIEKQSTTSLVEQADRAPGMSFFERPGIDRDALDLATHVANFECASSPLGGGGRPGMMSGIISRLRAEPTIQPHFALDTAFAGMLARLDGAMSGNIEDRRLFQEHATQYREAEEQVAAPSARPRSSVAASSPQHQLIAAQAHYHRDPASAARGESILREVFAVHGGANDVTKLARFDPNVKVVVTSEPQRVLAGRSRLDGHENPSTGKPWLSVSRAQHGQPTLWVIDEANLEDPGFSHALGYELMQAHGSSGPELDPRLDPAALHRELATLHRLVAQLPSRWSGDFAPRLGERLRALRADYGRCGSLTPSEAREHIGEVIALQTVLRQKSGEPLNSWGAPGYEAPAAPIKNVLAPGSKANRFERVAAVVHDDAFARAELEVAVALREVDTALRTPPAQTGSTRPEAHARIAYEIADRFALSFPLPDAKQFAAFYPASLRGLAERVMAKAAAPGAFATWISGVVGDIARECQNSESHETRSLFEQGRFHPEVVERVLEQRLAKHGFVGFETAWGYIEPDEFQGWFSDGKLALDPFYTDSQRGPRGVYSWPLQALFLADVDPDSVSLFSALGDARSSVNDRYDERLSAEENGARTIRRQAMGPFPSVQPDTEQTPLNEGQRIQDVFFLTRPFSQISFLNADMLGLLAGVALPGATRA
ncbi:MAG: hypothetical protein AAFZ38_09510 [Myxococcota bacterium]